jgi:hypothetical protein
MPNKGFFAAVLLVVVCAGQAVAGEPEALDLSRRIRERHTPHGTVIDPIFTTPSSDTVARYTRGGDSAIWTGHWLAAEAFRFKVTGDPEALANVKVAVKAIRELVNVTGTGLLARVRVPVEWEESVDDRAIITEEAGHGVYHSRLKNGVDHYWIGNTSRDQYSGVYFGLSVAYELVDESADPKVRHQIRKTVTKSLRFLLANDWAVRMPNGSVSTVFTGRFDQQLALLQVGRQVNPAEFAPVYEKYRKRYAALAGVPIALETDEPHESYFKFNLDYVNLYTLVRLEEDARAKASYLSAFRVLRDATATHGNAHFNMIDRALRGPDTARDAETARLLGEWLGRPSRDEWVDLRCCEEACGDDRACEPLAVAARVRTDFLWQRSPFLLYGGGYGTIETAGIDYILPYWMARYYQVPV